MTNYTFPEICNPILEAIRKEVPRPSTDPDFMVIPFRFKERCPMGMLPFARYQTPKDIYGFSEVPSGFTDAAIINFAYIWDTFKDPVKAVEAVWGKE